MTEHKHIEVIKHCSDCNLFGKCYAYNKLTPKQKCSASSGKHILINCHLGYNKQNKND